MVGDTCAADVVGGRALGMTTVWKRNGRRDLPPCAHAGYTIDHLSELLALPFLARVTPTTAGEAEHSRRD